MQRTFRDEFYTQPLPTRIPELQTELGTYLDHYNGRRPLERLHWVGLRLWNTSID